MISSKPLRKAGKVFVLSRFGEFSWQKSDTFFFANLDFPSQLTGEFC